MPKPLTPTPAVYQELKTAPTCPREKGSRTGWLPLALTACGSSRSLTRKGETWQPLRRQWLHEVEDFVVLGETPGLVLAVDESAIDPDIEDAAGSGNQLWFNVVGMLDFGRQTGSPGEVASLLAVGDAHLHRSRSECGACPPVGTLTPDHRPAGGPRQRGRGRRRERVRGGGGAGKARARRPGGSGSASGRYRARRGAGNPVGTRRSQR